MRRCWLLVAACGCAGAQASSAQHGGTIRVADMPARNIEVGPDALVVWGMTEVPGGSRLQAAKAMVDAITRAELLKFVQVGVGSLELDVEMEQAGITRRQLELVSAEVVRGELPTATPIQHGWERAGDVLRLVGRLEVSRQLLRDTLATKLPASQADAIVTHLFRIR